MISDKALNLLRPQGPHLHQAAVKDLVRIARVQSWAWPRIVHCRLAVDVAAIFRLPVSKTGKDAHVSAALGRESWRTASTFIFRGSI